MELLEVAPPLPQPFKKTLDSDGNVDVDHHGGHDDGDYDDNLGSQDWLASLSHLGNHGKFHISSSIQVLVNLIILRPR